MFLHDYLLACEISTVRTQTLTVLLVCMLGLGAAFNAGIVGFRFWFSFMNSNKVKYQP